MKKFTLLLCFILASVCLHAQNVGIGNTNPSFLLDVSGQLRIRSKDAVSTAGIYLNKIDNTGLQAYVGMHSDNYVGFFGVPLNAWGMTMHTGTGYMGIGNTNPQFLLDVSGRARFRSMGGANTAGIYFNKSDNSSTQAFVGMQSDSYVGLFGVPLNNWGLLMNTTTGNIGVGNNPSPQAMLHVVRGTKTNGPLLPSSAVVIDGDQGGWVQLSNNNNIENGILSGNQQTAIRSGLVFGTDSSVQIRAGGNFSQLTIDKLGNVSAANNISAEGSANISGNATISGNAIVTGEVRRPATGSANLTPLAYGSINLVGTIQSGSGNFTITWLGGGRYRLNVTGEILNTTNCIVIITLISGCACVGTVTMLSNELTIFTNNSSGDLADNAFNFVVYKP